MCCCTQHQHLRRPYLDCTRGTRSGHTSGQVRIHSPVSWTQYVPSTPSSHLPQGLANCTQTKPFVSFFCVCCLAWTSCRPTILDTSETCRRRCVLPRHSVARSAGLRRTILCAQQGEAGGSRALATALIFRRNVRHLRAARERGDRLTLRTAPAAQHGTACFPPLPPTHAHLLRSALARPPARAHSHARTHARIAQ